MIRLLMLCIYYDLPIKMTLILVNRKMSDHISIKFMKGKIYRIFGLNGSGKTSLIMALMGLYNNIIDWNTIFYNGIDIKNINTYNFRKEKLCYLSQKLSNINYSVLKDNLITNGKLL